jgi:hypothetical protein
MLMCGASGTSTDGIDPHDGDAHVTDRLRHASQQRGRTPTASPMGGIAGAEHVTPPSLQSTSCEGSVAPADGEGAAEAVDVRGSATSMPATMPYVSGNSGRRLEHDSDDHDADARVVPPRGESAPHHLRRKEVTPRKDELSRAGAPPRHDGGGGKERRRQVSQTALHEVVDRWRDFLDCHPDIDARLLADKSRSGPTWKDTAAWAVWLLTSLRPQLAGASSRGMSSDAKASPREKGRGEEESEITQHVVIPLQPRGHNLAYVERFLALAESNVFAAICACTHAHSTRRTRLLTNTPCLRLCPLRLACAA